MFKIKEYKQNPDYQKIEERVKRNYEEAIQILKELKENFPLEDDYEYCWIGHGDLGMHYKGLKNVY